MKNIWARSVLCLTLISLLSGCAGLVSSVTSRMADDLASAILNSEDVDTVREGVPAYLLLIDSFLRGDPESVDLLLAASSLNGSFSAIVDDPQRVKLLADKSLNYAEQAACLSSAMLCGVRTLDFAAFEETLNGVTHKEVPAVYALGVAWVGWIQSHSDDWTAIAELGRAKALMAQVLRLDERYENGGPHLYMGGMETLLPASLGGRPEIGRDHFERALAINDRYLMTRVIYAEQYARLVFDQALHDRLLHEVIEADPVAEGMTLTNRIAQERARTLLATSSDYF